MAPNVINGARFITYSIDFEDIRRADSLTGVTRVRIPATQLGRQRGHLGRCLGNTAQRQARPPGMAYRSGDGQPSPPPLTKVPLC